MRFYEEGGLYQKLLICRVFGAESCKCDIHTNTVRGSILL